jgi:hypothetical protein
MMAWKRTVLNAFTLALFLVFLYTCYESVVKLKKGDIAKTTGNRDSLVFNCSTQ